METETGCGLGCEPVSQTSSEMGSPMRREAKIAINAHILLTGLSCLGLALSACTTTYSESDVANEPLDESASEADGEASNCSILADQPGCEMESPFDPQDDEQEF